jgi:ankyrin repeat protein
MSVLHVAVLHGNVVAFEKLIEKCARFEEKNNKGQTVLHLAANHGDERVVEQLIKMNADVNEIDNQGRSALHYSIEQGNMLAAMKLLEAGASVNGQNNQGETVLHLAVQHADEKMIDELIKKNAEVNEVDNKGRSALFYSIERGNMVAAMKLLEAGASVKGENDEGQTVLHLAVKHGGVEIIPLLLKNNEVYEFLNDLDCKGKSVLYYALEKASETDDPNIAFQLVKAGAKAPLVKDWQGNTLLHNAVRENKLNFLNILLQCNLDLNDYDNEGKAALHYAVDSGNKVATEMLLQAGADVNVREITNKFTPLHLAVMRRSDDIVELLLNYNANSKLEDYIGRTAMKYARNPDVIKKMEQAITGFSPEGSEDEVPRKRPKYS